MYIVYSMKAEDEIGTYAWTTSCIVDEKDGSNWLSLAKVLMHCSSLEEYKIARDLATENPVQENMI